MERGEAGKGRGWGGLKLIKIGESKKSKSNATAILYSHCELITNPLLSLDLLYFQFPAVR